MSNSKNNSKKIIFDLEGFISELKKIIPSISEKEIEIIKKIHNFIIESIKIKGERLCFYGCEYHHELNKANPQNLINFIDELLKEYKKEDFEKLVHYLLILNPPRLNVKYNDREPDNNTCFYSFILYIITTFFSKGLIKADSLIDNRNFIGTMLLYNDGSKFSSDLTYEDYLSMLLELSIRYGLNINHKDNNGDTILNIAVKNDKLWENEKKRYGCFYAGIVYKLSQCGFDFTLMNNDELVFLDIIIQAQLKNPIENEKICDSPHHGGRLLSTYNYFETIVSRLEEVYGKDNAICLSKEECEKRIKILNSRINRLRKFLQVADNEEDKETNIRSIYSNKCNEYAQLMELAKEKINCIDLLSPNLDLLINLISQGTLNINKTVELFIVGNIMGQLNSIAFINCYQSGKKDEAIEIFINSLNTFIVSYTNEIVHSRELKP